jgi:hypothetical protein
MLALVGEEQVSVEAHGERDPLQLGDAGACDRKDVGVEQ